MAAFTTTVTVMAFVAPPIAVTVTVYWVEDNAAVGEPEMAPAIKTESYDKSGQPTSIPTV